MRSYCAVYVDAGYLLASAATRVTGTSLRTGIVVDHPALIESIVTQAEQDSGLPLLRVNWYDSGPGRGGMPDRTQEEIGLLSRVKLRLGRLSYSGEQKGVDLRIGLDLVSHARSRAVDVMYLVSGDDDLTEAVEEAQVHGIQVMVLAAPDADGLALSVSRHLLREADGMSVLDAKAIDSAVVPSSQAAGAPDAAAETVPAPSPASPAAPGAPAGAATHPTPATLASRRLPVRVRDRVAAPATGEVAYSTGAHTPEQVAIVDDVCRGVLATWQQTATADERAELRQGGSMIPGPIDRALLIDTSAKLRMDDLDERTRFLLRRRFWVVAEQQFGRPNGQPDST